MYFKISLKKKIHPFQRRAFQSDASRSCLLSGECERIYCSMGLNDCPQILDFCFCCDRLCDREWVILTCHYIDHTHTHTNTDQPVSTKQQSVYLAPVSQCPMCISQAVVLYRTTHIYTCVCCFYR